MAENLLSDGVYFQGHEEYFSLHLCSLGMHFI